jgi:hypothetical protein
MRFSMRVVQSFFQDMPRTALPLAAVAAFTLAACNKDKQGDAATRDVAMTTDSTAMSPTLRDTAPSIQVMPPAPVPTPEVTNPAPVATTPAPAAPRAAPRTTPRPKPAAPRASAPTTSSPAPAPAAPSAPAEPARSTGEIASGTSFRVTSGAKVCSSTLQVGERITATTTSVISGSNGVSIPAGSRVGLVVTKSKTSGAQNDPAELAFDIRNVTFGGETYTAQGEVTTEAVVMERKGGDGKKVAVGAAAGAVIGNVIGGGSRAQRTVVGAAAGGLAGAAAAAITGDRFACLPEGSTLNVRLGSAMTVRN